MQEAESVALAPKSVPDLSTFILWGCEILFDLITILTWHFGAGNLDVELLNKKVCQMHCGHHYVLSEWR